MAVSRLRRFEEQRLKKRFALAIVGSIGILVFLGLFGLKILVGFSLFIDKLRGTTPVKTGQTLILPPVVNPLPEATNSAEISVSGSGQAGLILILYVNGDEFKKVPISADGNFAVADISVHEGTNVISAKATDDRGNLSDLSNVVSIVIKRTPPALEVAEPRNNTTVNGDKNTVRVQGTVEDATSTVTINGRFVVVAANGTFSSDFPLNSGNNTLTITATDLAGNQTTVKREVAYEK